MSKRSATRTSRPALAPDEIASAGNVAGESPAGESDTPLASFLAFSDAREDMRDATPAGESSETPAGNFVEANEIEANEIEAAREAAGNPPAPESPATPAGESPAPESGATPAPFTLTIPRRTWSAGNFDSIIFAQLARETGTSLTLTLATPAAESEILAILTALESRLYPVRYDRTQPAGTEGTWWNARQLGNLLRARAGVPILTRTSGHIPASTPAPAPAPATLETLILQAATLQARLDAILLQVAAATPAPESSETPA